MTRTPAPPVPHRQTQSRLTVPGAALGSCATLALAWLVIVALATLTACSRRADARDWLARTEAAHHDADRLLVQGDVAAARAALRAAAEATAPKQASPVDARAVRQDLYCRLATLEAEHDAPAEAVRWATAGLALGRGEDVFTANLEIVRGRALERLGDASGASRDYHDALVVTEALLDQSLGGAGKLP